MPRTASPSPADPALRPFRLGVSTSDLSIPALVIEHASADAAEALSAYRAAVDATRTAQAAKIAADARMVPMGQFDDGRMVARPGVLESEFDEARVAAEHARTAELDARRAEKAARTRLARHLVTAAEEGRMSTLLDAADKAHADAQAAIAALKDALKRRATLDRLVGRQRTRERGRGYDDAYFLRQVESIATAPLTSDAQRAQAALDASVGLAGERRALAAELGVTLPEITRR
nr:hypothetical protein [Microbacterium lemovicicum]